MRANESRPERIEAASKAGGPVAMFPRAAAGLHFPRPDLWQRYPDPRVNLRRMTWGLTLDALRDEWARCRNAGWLPWELAERFPTSPEEVRP